MFDVNLFVTFLPVRADWLRSHILLVKADIVG